MRLTVSCGMRQTFWCVLSESLEIVRVLTRFGSAPQLMVDLETKRKLSLVVTGIPTESRLIADRRGCAARWRSGRDTRRGGPSLQCFFRDKRACL